MHRLTVEIADTPTARAIGLKNRDYLPDDEGMLFLFDEPGVYPFTGADCLLPLDIAFIAPDMTVLSIHEIEPGHTTVMPESEIIAAVEANRGWFAEHGVVPGMRLWHHIRIANEKGAIGMRRIAISLDEAYAMLEAAHEEYASVKRELRDALATKADPIRVFGLVVRLVEADAREWVASAIRSAVTLGESIEDEINAAVRAQRNRYSGTVGIDVWLNAAAEAERDFMR